MSTKNLGGSDDRVNYWGSGGLFNKTNKDAENQKKFDATKKMKKILTELAPQEMERYFAEFSDEMFFKLVHKTKMIDLPEEGQGLY